MGAVDQEQWVHDWEKGPPTRRPNVQRRVRIGIDVGQRVDPTAIVVCELEERIAGRHVSEAWDSVTGEYIPGKREVYYLIRHVERLPIGTSYPAVAARIVQLVESVQALVRQPDFRPELIVDITGVGRPLVDLLRQTLIGHSYRLIGATITSGDRLHAGAFTDEVSVGKAYLVSRAQALMQTGRVKLPDSAEARQLAEELKDFEVNITEKGTFTASAKGGAHDDLVIALALALLLPDQRRTILILDAADL